MALFAKLQSSGKCDGISFINSFPLRVSHQKRIYSHKTFKGLAARGKTSTGWFYGFKVHVIINSNGEILDFTITPGNVADSNAEIIERMIKNIHGKVILFLIIHSITLRSLTCVYSPHLTHFWQQTIV